MKENDGRKERPMTEAEKLAKRFHETYERLAPRFGYVTREDSAVSWENVPEQNKNLMIAVCSELINKIPKDVPRYLKLENDELVPSESNDAHLRFEQIDLDGSIIYRLTF